MKDHLNIEEIELVWTDDKRKKGIFYELAEDVDKEHTSPDLNLILVACKKTALSDIVNFFVKQIDERIDSNGMKKVSTFLAYTTLLVVYPRTSRLKFSKDDEVRDVFGLFKDDYGDQYLLKSDVSIIPNGNKVIEMLVRNEFLEEDDDKYYVKGYYLKNLELRKRSA